MTQKEKLLAIVTYEEFKQRRKEFEGLKPDKEIVEHLSKITPRSANTSEELYKTPPNKGGTIGR